MSTPQRSGRSSNGKSNGRASSLRKKQRVGTPGGAGRGVEFEAAVLEATPTAPRARGAGSGDATAGSKDSGSESERMDTFSYEDVSNLATVAPVVPKHAVSRVASEDVEPPEQHQRARVDKGKKRAAAERQGQAAASREEENGSRAAKRRKQRQQEHSSAAATTAAAAAAAAATPSKPDTATPNKRSSSSSSATTATPKRPKEKNKHVSSGSNGDANGDARAAAAAAGGVTGIARHETAAARGAGDGNSDEVGTAAAGADPRGPVSSKKQEQKGGSKSKPSQQGKGKEKAGDDKRGGRATKSVRKVPRYPRLAFEDPGVEVRSLADALRVAVSSEVQSLLRKRGKYPECKTAVEACLELGKEIIRRTGETCDGLESEPRVDWSKIRKIFSDQKQRRLAQIAEEEELLAIEEQKYMSLAESNKRSKAKVQDFDERRSRERVPSLTGVGDDELRGLLHPMGADEEEVSPSRSDGTEVGQRVRDQLLEWTNDMIGNASGIGSLLQEMGAEGADAQETKEKLAQALARVMFRNYPNVHDPKAGIAAMLK